MIPALSRCQVIESADPALGNVTAPWIPQSNTEVFWHAERVCRSRAAAVTRAARRAVWAVSHNQL